MDLVRLFLVLMAALIIAACVTTTQLCVECPYGDLALNRTMDTGK